MTNFDYPLPQNHFVLMLVREQLGGRGQMTDCFRHPEDLEAQPRPPSCPAPGQMVRHPEGAPSGEGSLVRWHFRGGQSIEKA